MLSLSAKIRENNGKGLRSKGILPAVLYGPKIKPQSIEIDLAKFKKIFKEIGESALVSLKVGDKEFLVLVHEIQKDPVSSELIHVDFYQPILTEEVEVSVPVVFEGEAPAVKELGGTLVKEIQEIEVKALPQNLPHEIKVNVEKLKTFEDEILVKDLKVFKNVKIQKGLDEIVANVIPLVKVEEELEKPVEEGAEKIEDKEDKEEEKEEKESEEMEKEKKSKENKED